MANVELMLELALSNPTSGCVRLSDELKLRNVSISSPTIRKLLINRGLGSKYERLLRFEERASKQKIELTAAQMRLIAPSHVPGRATVVGCASEMREQIRIYRTLVDFTPS